MAKRKARMAAPKPSNAHRWIPCHGYLQAVVDAPEQEENIYMREGTTAHAVLEASWRLGTVSVDLIGKKIEGLEVTTGMVDAVQVALDFIKEWITQRPGAVVRHECELTITLGDRTLTGTADVVLWSPKTRELVIIDYKNGIGIPVDAENNYQLAMYLLGALSKTPTAKTLTGIVIQPRERFSEKPVKEWRVKLPVLRRIEGQAIEALHVAEQPGAPRSAGTHCKGCAAAGTCRTLAEYSLRTAMTNFQSIESRPLIEPDNPQQLTADGIAYAMSQVYVVEGWLRAVEAEAVRRMLAGFPVPGYKLTRGRQMRSWGSEPQVWSMLKRARIPEDTFAPRKLRSPAQILELTKKDAKLVARLNAMIVKKPGVAHVAPENDPRPALPGAAGLVFQPILAPQP